MKSKGEIKKWNPFFASFVDYQSIHQEIIFKCPGCGSDSCERETKTQKPDPYFFQGNFKCSNCGKKRFNYYSDCFIKTPKQEVQLTLFD